MNVNKVIIAGCLTRDIELRTSQGGQSIAKLGMAINRKWTQNGESKESTCFVDLVAFGRQAEVMAQYLAKGSAVFVEGRLEFSTWEAKDGGGKRSKLEVVVEQFQFVGGREKSAAPAEAPAPRKSTWKSRPDKHALPPEPAKGEDADYGEIPF